MIELIKRDWFDDVVDNIRVIIGGNSKVFFGGNYYYWYFCRFVVE